MPIRLLAATSTLLAALVLAPAAEPQSPPIRPRTVTLNQGWLYGTAALIAILAALAALTGCSQKFLEPFRAAPTAGGVSSPRRPSTRATDWF